MHLKTPTQYRKMGIKKLESQEEPKVNIKKLAEDFVDGPLREDIEASICEGDNYANTQVPSGTYGRMDQFIKECRKLLKPMGYTAEESHDGGGIYTTVFVSWVDPMTASKI